MDIVMLFPKRSNTRLIHWLLPLPRCAGRAPTTYIIESNPPVSGTARDHISCFVQHSANFRVRTHCYSFAASASLHSCIVLLQADMLSSCIYSLIRMQEIPAHDKCTCTCSVLGLTYNMYSGPVLVLGDGNLCRSETYKPLQIWRLHTETGWPFKSTSFIPPMQVHQSGAGSRSGGPAC